MTRLEVTGSDIRQAEVLAVNDALNGPGSRAGLTPLVWTSDPVGFTPWALSGVVDAGVPDNGAAAIAHAWAEALGLEAADPVSDGTVEYRGRLDDGRPVAVWAVVDRDVFDAAHPGSRWRTAADEVREATRP